jgi:hypothetical protein
MLTRVGDVQLIGWICQLGDVQLMSCGLPRMRLSWRILFTEICGPKVTGIKQQRLDLHIWRCGAVSSICL